MNMESSDHQTSGFSTPIGTRRRFFQWATGAAASIIALGLGVPLIGFLIAPAFQRRAQSWVDVGGVDDLPIGKPAQLDYKQTVKEGWRTTAVHKGVWAVKRQDGQVTVFSPICTHLGCGFNWDGADRNFKCPCHGSVFAMDGAVLGGPAPRPLDELPSKVENGRLLVMYKEFKAGLPKKVEL
ncbi:Ubiquinol-cytochrome c reductase iron-sulfur subunit [Nitrospira tepida]|uniref:Ubiquinol-cytochrome c reductase iron-sulfur subunit n=1 Tax=Nitrospira tepida TaxID=2973512 RepID=A0AA86T996_9BACT|nr:ubiquinol-cytochrome c reductase iron-sulfur subunit [Nitrospira tepida]CAI4033932.1 Ubiquinol-cytochrome c reductase iron-sulfur subunit [Nitrospira tepida]